MLRLECLESVGSKNKRTFQQPEPTDILENCKGPQRPRHGHVRLAVVTYDDYSDGDAIDKLLEESPVVFLYRWMALC